MAVLGVALALCLGALGTASAPALAQGSGYYVTFVARSCPSYMDIFANKARNDILESLEDLGPDTQYTKPAQLVDPAYEDLSPQDACSPLPGWKFTLGASTSNPPPPPPEPTVPPTPPSPTKRDATPAYALSDLAVTKQALTPVAIRGQAVSYRITVTNHGPDPAERVVVDDQPSGHAVIVDVRAPVGSCRRTPHLVCQLGTVKAHDSVVLTVSLIPMPGSEWFTNRAVVGTATQELTLANNSTMATVRVLVPGPPPSGGRG